MQISDVKTYTLGTAWRNLNYVEGTDDGLAGDLFGREPLVLATRAKRPPVISRPAVAVPEQVSPEPTVNLALSEPLTLDGLK